MSKKVSFVVSEPYRENSIFKTKDNILNRDNCLKPYVELQKRLAYYDIEIATCDKIRPLTADVVLFLDVPKRDDPYLAEAIDSGSPLLAIALENAYMYKENRDFGLHSYFDRILTYQDDLIDNVKYFKINYPISFPVSIDVDFSKKKKLCTMICGNKSMDHSDELYTERIKAIRWFEKNHPEDFDLFGVGWNELYTFNLPRFGKYLNKLKFLRELMTVKYPSYRGAVEFKLPVLQKYKYSISYENIQNAPGYITEKIFDSFFAGCVPVYLGIEEINEVIPAGCFIDKRDFSTYRALYKYLISINEEQYMNYIDNINKYISSDQKNCFTIDSYLEKIISSLKDYI